MYILERFPPPKKKVEKFDKNMKNRYILVEALFSSSPKSLDRNIFDKKSLNGT